MRLTRPFGVVFVLLALSGALLSSGGVSAAGSGAQPRADAHTVAGPGMRHPAQTPLVAVVGASFAAGVGAAAVDAGWAQQMSRMLGWRLVVSADSGAGYLNSGARRGGPLARLAARLELGRLHPAVLLIQGGHNDIGQPLGLLSQRVYDLVSAVRRVTQTTRIGVITVFTTRGKHSNWALATDQVIVGAARRADPQIMVFDPLATDWHFARGSDGLHPSPAGHHWIAVRLAQDLRGELRPAPRSRVGAPPGVRCACDLIQFLGSAGSSQRLSCRHRCRR